MARMRLLVSVAGEDSWYPGQEVDVDEQVAAAWCDGVRAERVDEQPKKAAAPPVKRGPQPGDEKAVAPPGGERRG